MHREHQLRHQRREELLQERQQREQTTLRILSEQTTNSRPFQEALFLDWYEAQQHRHRQSKLSRKEVQDSLEWRRMKEELAECTFKPSTKKPGRSLSPVAAAVAAPSGSDADAAAGEADRAAAAPPPPDSPRDHMARGRSVKERAARAEALRHAVGVAESVGRAIAVQAAARGGARVAHMEAFAGSPMAPCSIRDEAVAAAGAGVPSRTAAAALVAENGAGCKRVWFASTDAATEEVPYYPECNDRWQCDLIVPACSPEAAEEPRALPEAETQPADNEVLVEAACVAAEVVIA